MPRPNLFAFATSELSQDAAIAWLLSWADPAHARVAPVLHAAGSDLLAAIFAKHGLAAPEASATVVAERQFHRIDVLVRVGDTAVIANRGQDRHPTPL
jgi:hypothetical protein